MSLFFAGQELKEKLRGKHVSLAHMQKLIKIILARLGVSASFAGDVTSLLLASSVNNGSLLVVNFIVARYYAQELYGIFSVAVNALMMTLTIAEFGMNYSMIRIYKEHEKDVRERQTILQAHLYFKMLILAVLVLLSFSISRPLAELLVQRREQWPVIGAALVGGGILAIWGYFRAFYQILSRFRIIAGLTVLYAILRLSFVGCLFLFDDRRGSSSAAIILLGVYVVPLLLISTYSALIFKRHCPISPVAGFRRLHAAWVEGAQYAKWIALTGGTFVMLQQSLVVIVSIIGGVNLAAILNAGLMFTAVFSLINIAVSQVLYPKIVGYSTGQIASYRRRLILFLPWWALVTVSILAFCSLVMVYGLGDRYRDSLSIFWITGGCASVTTCIGFYSMTMHAIKRPEIGAYVNMFSLLLFVLIGTVLMKLFGLHAVTVFYAVVLVGGECLKAVFIDRQLTSVPG